MLSVVLPLRVTPRTSYLLERLDANLGFFGAHPDVECVVVDSASARRYRAAIRRACARPRCTLVVDPRPQRPFAPGMARNAGAARAAGDHLLFYDVDLCGQPDFVPRVMDWLAAGPAATEFLMIPCLYLTRAGTLLVGPTGAGVDLSPYRASLLAGDNRLVSHVAVSTSTVVAARSHFLALGGNRPEYRGHGCEDFDLLHRLASYAPLGRRPADYYDDVKTPFPGDNRGLRGYLARYALPHLLTGLYTAHLWHPRPLSRRYFRRRARNEVLFQEMMRWHDVKGIPAPGLTAPWQGEGDAELPALAASIARLMAEHGYDPAEHPGLFRWSRAARPPRRSGRGRLRKLVLRPRAFFTDSRVRVVRPLRHLFRR